MKTIIPTWRDLEFIVQNAKNELTICVPFYSETGLNHIIKELTNKLTINLYTRISPSDWANRISDPEALLEFLNRTSSLGHSTALFVIQRLHAKAYIADKKQALIGSSNLSDGGFEQNLEIMVVLKGKLVDDVVFLINTRIKSEARKLSPIQLKDWIDRNKKTVEDVRRDTEATQAVKLRNAQRNLDRMLRFGRGRTKIRTVKKEELKKFFEWLNNNKHLAGSKILIARHENSDGQNLQGHVKQCFFSILRFLLENPFYQSPLSIDLNKLGEDDVFQLKDTVSEAWLKHIDKHATDIGESYDYSVLRGILPPSVGGTRLGGGGGISSLKRMFPLVARYIEESM